jgi:hypothetical protein
VSDLPDEVIEGPVEQFTLDPYSSVAPKFVVVVDTDALLSSIDNHCRTGWEPRLLRIGGSRASCVYAEDHVYGETYKGFKKIAASSSVSVGELKACFEQHYLPVLRWVETDGDGIADERVVHVTDETDVPTAELASLIAPCLVLSEDRALRRPGFAPNEWRLAAGHGAEVVEGSRMQGEVVMAMGLPLVAVVGGGIKLGQVVRLPWWVSVALMGAGGYALFRSAERRKSIGEKVRPLIELVGEMMAEATAREQAGARGLKEVMFKPAAPPTGKQQVATVLARSREPLLATEIHELIERHFGGSAPASVEVRAILKTSPEFTQPERYRWQLGRIGGPWRGAP